MSAPSSPPDFVMCGSHDCSAWAVSEFRWPGRDWQPACLVCLHRAEAIAGVMGFALEERKHEQADRLVEFLRGDSRTRRLEVD